MQISCIPVPKKLIWAALFAAAAMMTGCGKNDSISQAEKKDVAQRVPAPSIEETKAIAEEGFIYGLAPVMYYGDHVRILGRPDLEPVQGTL